MITLLLLPVSILAALILFRMIWEAILDWWYGL